jgi:hypothetical protein
MKNMYKELLKNKTFFYLWLISFLMIFATVSCEKENPEPEENNENNIVSVFGGDFEDWETVTQGSVSFEKPTGDWWDGLNTLATIGGPITLTKTEDAYSGNYAARLETKLWGDDLSIPGILASGFFDKELPMGDNLVVGKPFVDKPIRFDGFYKYQPQDNDTLIILIALTRYDTDNNLQDTIAKAELVSNQVQDNYSPFSLTLNYYNNQTPDSIHIILLASAGGKNMQGNPGSVLFIDDLSLVYE